MVFWAPCGSREGAGGWGCLGAWECPHTHAHTCTCTNIPTHMYTCTEIANGHRHGGIHVYHVNNMFNMHVCVHGTPPTHAHTCTCTHIPTHMYTCTEIANGHRHGGIHVYHVYNMFNMHVYVCVCVCAWDTPHIPTPNPTPSTGPQPLKGDPGIGQNSITLELIEIFQFRLKI